MATIREKPKLRTRLCRWLLIRFEVLGYWVSDSGPHIWMLHALQDPRDRERYFEP